MTTATILREPELKAASPAELRAMFREGALIRPTAGLAPGYVQANLVVLPKEQAFDFLLFCQRNPQAMSPHRGGGGGLGRAGRLGPRCRSRARPGQV